MKKKYINLKLLTPSHFLDHLSISGCPKIHVHFSKVKEKIFVVFQKYPPERDMNLLKFEIKNNFGKNYLFMWLECIKWVLP